MKNWKKWADRLLTLAFGLCVLVVVWVLLQVTCFTSFMAGDNLDNSKDSRYWGLVPEPYIVGVATRVWKSVSPQGGEVRWNRTMKKIE